MLFTEPAFLFLFLPVLLGLYVLAATKPLGLPYANYLLVVASVIFYALGGGQFTWLILASITLNYWMAIVIGRTHSRAMLTAAVLINLGGLAVFKYAGFAVDNLNLARQALHLPPLALPAVALPIGISFFTFHAVSYVVDVYRGDAVAQKSPVHAALYMLLFPQLIAGPIIRYRDIASQLARRTVSIDDLSEGIARFVVGLAKKVLIANTVAATADQLFGLPLTQVDAGRAWLGITCYTLQIYFDFSGYSDMAIGLGRLFGFHFPENFSWPYAADSVQRFWRRWHMSLSAWFRDYVYVPLGGSRQSPLRTYVNLITVFFLCGLWHGASWTFVVWGLFHGLFLVLERLGLATLIDRLPRPLRHTYVMLVVMVGWVFFRSDSFGQAIGWLAAMAGAGHAGPTPLAISWYVTPELMLALVAGCVGSTPIVPVVNAWLARTSDRPNRGREAAALAALAILFAVSVVQVAAGTYNPFIYFRF